MFVDTQPVPVTDDEGENTIWVLSKMTFGVRNKVLMAATDGGKEADTGAYLTALLAYNVVRWEGPKFLDEHGKPIPCTPENVARMDPAEPIVDMALEEVARRNPLDRKPQPVVNGSNGSRKHAARARAR